MKRKYLKIFLASLLAFLAICWSLGIKNNEPSWAEAVLYFTLTFLSLNNVGDEKKIVPVVSCVIAGRVVLDITLCTIEAVSTGGIEPAYSWFMTFMSVMGAITAALYYRWPRPWVLATIVLVAIVLIVGVQPLWSEFVVSLR